MSTNGSFRFVASSRSQPTMVSMFCSHQSQPFRSIVRARALQEQVGEAVMPTSFRSFLSSVPGPEALAAGSGSACDFKSRGYSEDRPSTTVPSARVILYLVPGESLTLGSR
jgi:hypothetical protein